MGLIVIVEIPVAERSSAHLDVANHTDKPLAATTPGIAPPHRVRGMAHASRNNQREFGGGRPWSVFRPRAHPQLARLLGHSLRAGDGRRPPAGCRGDATS